MMAKIHFGSPSHSYSHEYPDYMIEEFAKGYRETLCGYLRKQTTSNDKEVTCFYCKKLIEKLFSKPTKIKQL